VAQAGARVASGLAAQVDLAQARAYHALARGGTAAARQAQADARAALAEVAGAPIANLRPLATALPQAGPEDADDWVTRALQANPSLRARELAVQAGDETLAAARRAHGPTVNLSVGAERLRPTAGDSRNNSTVAVALTLPLFSGGATASLARQAVYERDTAREALEAERRRVQRETRAQWQALVSGLAQLDTSQLSVDAAREALAATRTGQTLGTRSSTDLLLAIQTLTSAQNALAQARQQVVLARLRLALVAGALDEPALAAVNAWLQP
ncbi:MAG: TolC family protein, partial [Bacteroidia bacterium]